MQFLVKKGRVLTPHADYCLPGITRATVSGMNFCLLIVKLSLKMHLFSLFLASN